MSPSSFLVESKAIKQAILYKNVPVQYHFYALPFTIVYVAYLAAYLNFYSTLFGSPEFANFCFILLGTIHALCFLVCQWSVNAKALFTCARASSPETADVIKIIPTKFNGSGAICKLERMKTVIFLLVEANLHQTNTIFFTFQKLKFVYDDNKKYFTLLEYKEYLHQPFSHFKSYVGLSDSKVDQITELHGLNKFDIPIPTFQDLMKEHVIAPFFVFQLFCVALWFLDDMWYYSLFTLFMLFVFESTVVMQRLKTINEFRTMSTKPYPIQVYRNCKWIEIFTDNLLPGDICSVVRSAEDCPIPCDLLLLDGSCIANEAMLSGESTPQLKESLALRDGHEEFVFEDDKIHILFGGTKILQVQKPALEAEIQTPNNGCLAYVVKTGFSTQQGELVRMIIYSTERVTANNLESLFFILFLLVFAIIAAYYVWTEGIKNEERKRSKVLLDCILIVTSVVPPELPMELSLAVNNSLLALSKCYVYCTEPFRIPFAGKIDVACFDKTGTLTVENLRFEGVTGLGKDQSLLTKQDLPSETLMVLAGAHSLVLLDALVVGDPMEKNTVESLGWTIDQDDNMRSATTVLKIKRRFAFSSALKRMSTVCQIVTGAGAGTNFVAVKGAPEMLKSMYRSIPANYDEIYKSWARKGSRVLALGYKEVKGELRKNQILEMHRNETEHDLNFAGFLIFYCPLKEDSKAAIKMLNESYHRCVMITGDNPLTACHVANEVEIMRNPALIYDEWGNDGLYVWKTADEKSSYKVLPENSILDPSLKSYDLCVTGPGLSYLANHASFELLLPKIRVYARVSPNQKEFILKSLKNCGYTTLMCGDGTNDVGALKQADIGIALLDGSVEDMEKIATVSRQRFQQKMYNKQCEFAERMGAMIPPPPNPSIKAYVSTKTELNRIPVNNNLTPRERKKADAQKNLETAMQQMMGDTEEDMPQIKFGDASVAAPFTSKISSVMSGMLNLQYLSLEVCNIIRQGRSTLVAMIQMYKILALNCIISAYSMSVLYLAGIKQGDWQATIAGFLLTICFFGVAKSNALEKLSKKRPQPNIFNSYLILSILGQAAVHIGALMYIRSEAMFYSEELEEVINLDKEFKPSLLNTAVYLVSLTMQIATFAVNYQGEPFRESLRSNKPLFSSLRTVSLIAILAASELFPMLNDWMQLVPMPNEFRIKLCLTMALDVSLSYGWEQLMDKTFSANKPKRSLYE